MQIKGNELFAYNYTKKLGEVDKKWDAEQEVKDRMLNKN